MGTSSMISFILAYVVASEQQTASLNKLSLSNLKHLRLYD